MAGIRRYSYSHCSSCKNAEQMLREAGVPFEQRDLFGQRLNAQEIHALFEAVGKTPSEMLSRRSAPFRSLGLADRVLDDTALIDLMAEYPALIRRPIVVAGNEALVGFGRTALAQLIDQSGEGSR